MSLDRSARTRHGFTEESQNIHICLIEIEINRKRHCLIGGAAGEKIAGEYALSTCTIVSFRYQCILQRHDIALGIRHQREAVKADFSVARMLDTDRDVSFRRRLISAENDSGRQTPAHPYVISSQYLRQPGHLHVFGCELDGELPIAIHRAFCCEQSISYRKMKLTDREHPIHVGKIDRSLTDGCIPQMSSQEICFEVDAGILQCPSDLHAAIDSAIRSGLRQLEKTHDLLDIPFLKSKEALQSMGIHVITASPFEMSILLVEYTVIKAYDMVLIIDTGRCHINGSASYRDLPGGDRPFKDRIFHRSGYMPAHIDLAVCAASRKHPRKADVIE